MEFQKEPIEHMIRVPNVANFSIPGAGKTVMAYAAYFILKSQKQIDQLFVICPRASFGPWTEIFEFVTGVDATKHIIRYHGDPANREKKLKKLKNYDIVLTTYDTAGIDLRQLRNYFRESKKKVMMILDESHRIKGIKEITTKKQQRTRAASMIRLGESYNVERRCILTGTPLPHEWDDLWSQITFLYPDRLPFGTRKEFLKIIDTLDESAMRRYVNDIIYPMWTRVSNDDLADKLPEKKRATNTNIAMDKDQEEIYSLIESQFNNQPRGWGEKKLREWQRTRVLRLLQAVTNPSLLIQNDPFFKNLPAITKKNAANLRVIKLVHDYRKVIPNKIKAVAKLATKLAKEKKNVVIFTYFVENVKLLARVINDPKTGIVPLWITGGETSLSASRKIKKVHDEQEQIVEDFKDWDFKNGKGKILIATIGTLGESVSLHRKGNKHVCNHAIFLERNYDAGKYMQALHRIYRIGSDKTKPIRYYIFTSEFANSTNDTLDDEIDGILERRINRLYELLGDEFELTPLSLDDEDEALEDKTLKKLFSWHKKR